MIWCYTKILCQCSLHVHTFQMVIHIPQIGDTVSCFPSLSLHVCVCVSANCVSASFVFMGISVLSSHRKPFFYKNCIFFLFRKLKKQIQLDVL